jgi:uncharacterized membrane protein YdjX (TVP38/TMEM64 family)
MSKRLTERTWFQVSLVVLVFALFAAMAWYYFQQYDRFNRENLEAFIREFGPWAPVAYAVVYVLSSPIPFLAPVISAVGGLLFGTLQGMLIVLVTATISALIPFTLARQLGRDWVESKVKGKKIEEVYRQSEGEKGFTFIVLMRLVPVLPWEVQNYVAGLTQVTVPIFIAGTVLGIIPGSFSLVFLGAAATDPTSWQFFFAVGLKIATALIPVVVTFIRSRRNKEDEEESDPSSTERGEEE